MQLRVAPVTWLSCDQKSRNAAMYCARGIRETCSQTFVSNTPKGINSFAMLVRKKAGIAASLSLTGTCSMRTKVNMNHRFLIYVFPVRVKLFLL